VNRVGSARWEGDLAHGKGTLRSASGAVSASYSFGTRFGDTPGTNPEELIAAAHAACFSMALAADLGKAGSTPRAVETTATVHLEKRDGRFTITGIDLDCRVSVDGLASESLRAIADGTKEGCPVSRALAAVPISLRVATV